jgi:hypothetical protein
MLLTFPAYAKSSQELMDGLETAIKTELGGVKVGK